MKSFHKQPAIGLVLLWLGVAAAGLWLVTGARQRAIRALEVLEEKRCERDRLAHAVPAPNAENAAAVAADLERLARLVTDAADAVGGGEVNAPLVAEPPKRLAVYLELAAFVSEERAKASAAGVTMKSGESFGFATYAREGPAQAMVSAVLRQQADLRRLLDALWESHPASFLGVQREKPRGANAAASSANDGVHDDFFVPDEHLRRVTAGADGSVFRLEFTGGTAALRTLLNRLAELRPPALVRRVEVEPVARRGATDGARSRFTVVGICERLLVPTPPRPL